jgi:hypothetical protein
MNSGLINTGSIERAVLEEIKLEYTDFLESGTPSAFAMSTEMNTLPY